MEQTQFYHPRLSMISKPSSIGSDRCPPLSMVVQNKKVSIDIPDDLNFSILSKLSLKSLIQFGCVRKSWSLLFKNPYFMSLFRNNFLSNNSSYYDGTSILLHTDNIIHFDEKHVLYSLSGERYENKTLLNFPNPFEEDDPDFYISGSGSINGILCLINKFEPNNRVVLWNPATTEFKIIPTSPCEFVPYMNVDIDQYGFGYDSVSDDYKVIQVALCDPKRDCDIDFSSLGEISFGPLWEVYSLRTNSWSKFRFDIPTNYEVQGVFLDGMCHWWGENDSFFDEDYALYLLSFDLSNEVFLTTFIPSEDDSLDIEILRIGLAVLNGYVAFISNYTQSNTFHISILGEIGVTESWVKLFIVCYVPPIKGPIGAGKKGDIFFRKEGCKLIYFNLSTQMIEELDCEEDKYWITLTYKASLLPIGETNILL
ncbi:unnamed protein product [Trifolium pratense]|uniref:Uncharacterized protein n=1 Tax=Trifolium pratense TaxID=57577 RepID=A0ACB0LKQ1_TRIPR|nr:unnamed protein product [Trifolium pratense]